MVVTDELLRSDAVGVVGVVDGLLGWDAGGVRQTPPSGELARDMWGADSTQGGGFHPRGRMRLGGVGVVEAGSFRRPWT